MPWIVGIKQRSLDARQIGGSVEIRVTQNLLDIRVL